MRLKLRPLRTLEVVSYSGPSPLFLPNHPSINSSIKLSSNLLILLSLILKNFIIVSFNLDLTHSNTVSQTISILSLSSVSSSFNSINQSTHPLTLQTTGRLSTHPSTHLHLRSTRLTPISLSLALRSSPLKPLQSLWPSSSLPLSSQNLGSSLHPTSQTDRVLFLSTSSKLSPS